MGRRSNVGRSRVEGPSWRGKLHKCGNMQSQIHVPQYTPCRSKYHHLQLGVSGLKPLLLPTLPIASFRLAYHISQNARGKFISASAACSSAPCKLTMTPPNLRSAHLHPHLHQYLGSGWCYRTSFAITETDYRQIYKDLELPVSDFFIITHSFSHHPLFMSHRVSRQAQVKLQDTLLQHSHLP